MLRRMSQEVADRRPSPRSGFGALRTTRQPNIRCCIHETCCVPRRAWRRAGRTKKPSPVARARQVAQAS